MKNFKTLSLLYFFAFGFVIFCCIAYRSVVFCGIITGVDYCLQTLIPSLFPMIFICCAVNNSPAIHVFSFIFSPLCRYFFKLPSCCACAVVFGMCFGYPVGAKLTSILLNQKLITKKQADRMLLFCINAGIPFTIVFIGGAIFDNMQLGLYIFISTTLASLLIGFLTSARLPVPKKQSVFYEQKNFAEIISTSASQSLSSTITMCLYIVIFSAFIPVFFKINLLQALPFSLKLELPAFLCFVLEVTNGVFNSISMHSSLNIYILGIAFGGLCVHLQAFSFFEKDVINYKKFYFCRVLNCVISLIIFKILNCFFAIEQQANANLGDVVIKASTSTAAASVCLILLACTYIYLNKYVEKTK